jgi:hypothetical protein
MISFAEKLIFLIFLGWLDHNHVIIGILNYNILNIIIFNYFITIQF